MSSSPNRRNVETTLDHHRREPLARRRPQHRPAEPQRRQHLRPVDRDKLFSVVASAPTAWRVIERVDAEHLARLRRVRALARERAWAAGAGPDLTAGLTIDLDATILISYSEKENAAATWKKTFGFHPLMAYLDRPDISGGEALAGMLRTGKAASNTAADHQQVLAMALAALPPHARPRPGEPDSPQVLIRTDSAGSTHGFARASGRLDVVSRWGSRSTARSRPRFWA